MSKLRVAVVKGGPSKEHDISLLSSKSVLDNLDKTKYEILDILVSKKNKWLINQKEQDDRRALQTLKDLSVDVVFLAVHGTYGEDGVLQAKLEKAGLNYTGSGSAASALAFNKQRAQDIFVKNGLRIPITEVIASKNDRIGLSLPVVVKPVAQGSSVGVSIVKVQAGLKPALEEAFKHDTKVMIQEYIDGRELSCGVLQREDKLQALPPTEIIPIKQTFYSYQAKYADGGSRHKTPPNMYHDIISKVQNSSKEAHEVLGCTGYSRTDMIVRGQEIFVIETNTLPGMTIHSLLPEQAKAAGISFGKLLDIIIANARK